MTPMEELREQAANIAEGHGYSQGYANFAAQIAAAIRAIPLPAPVALPQAGEVEPDDPSKSMLFSKRAKVMDAIENPAALLPRITFEGRCIEHEANWQARAVIKAMWQLGWRPPTPTETPTAATPDDGLMGRYREALRPFAMLADTILAEAPAAVEDIVLFIDCERKFHTVTMDQLRAVSALSTATGDEGGK